MGTMRQKGKGAITSTREIVITNMLAKLKRYRTREEQFKNRSKELQEELIPLMRGMDETDRKRFGFVYEGNELAGRVVQNQAPLVWLDGFIDELKEGGYWSEVSSEVLDQDKLHSAIERGIVPAGLVEKYKGRGEPPRAYVRFVAPETKTEGEPP